MAQSKNASTEPQAEKPAAEDARMRLNTAALKSTYCNVCNATSTREEVVLNFGVNQSWDRGPGELEVSLEHRIILSPFAAKRLSDMLGKLVVELTVRRFDDLLALREFDELLVGAAQLSRRTLGVL